MRILLVDNYDSFTHNLVHQLAEITGEEPVVVHNDDPDWHVGRLAEVDAVVLSPGPGTPERPADFGICRDLVERCELPLLGICLGHQGVALAHGATVARAPEPRHGRLSPVLHDGDGLFAGIPSPFEVVRYHSLAVTDLPDCLQATAWSPDGVLMGLRHRDRPMWGVQFHPESILTRHGRTLLANFVESARRWHAERPPHAPELELPQPARTVPEPPHETPPPPRELRFLVEELRTHWSDEAVYEELFGASATAFWLDSSTGAPSRGALGRFSFMGDASGPLARVVEADIWTNTATVHSAAGTEVVSGDFLTWLERDLAALRTTVPPLPFDFALGWVGYLGYELKAECGGNAVHRAEEPDAAMVFADRGVVFDHATGRTYLLALAEDGRTDTAHRWLHDTARTLDGLAGRPRAGAPVPTTGAEVTLRHDRDAYLGLIDAALEEIAAGESYEVCLTNMAEARGAFDPWESYRLLRRVSPAPFGALLRFGDLSVLSTSPERFVRVGADGLMESKPIKGTRPRGATPEEDAALVAELMTDEKDRAENLMIVDLVRNDLGRCAELGSVEAKDLFHVETYETVHQLVSTVRARLRADSSPVECVRAAFPPGSMTGAPKVRTMEIIDGLEAGPRGVYSGAIGYFSLSGAADLSVVIRTAVLTPGRLRYGVGGAVIALSSPEAEFEETAIKSRPLLALTGSTFPRSGKPPVRLVGPWDQDQTPAAA
ncbi:aminodeoxychorismate synthase component I [Streptomyces sp. LHD-70]|uniref:aminodeoxychorismate synthase component I n=1 Tax=Streptomyces sp. LHD-70 TaxID=3072140 RepID=UPI00280D2C1F|nr:aminodeoxychorismate synthase component I [Streptomyces sp. LHD-70]MDQ8707234.1 aminodeoxychorismate synthase component I [Streptomyces sp. LHD-70]